MPTSIVCPQCHMRSYNRVDIVQRYCGNCHKFHSDMELESQLEKPKDKADSVQ